jgi:hypothetical protein
MALAHFKTTYYDEHGNIPTKSKGFVAPSARKVVRHFRTTFWAKKSTYIAVSACSITNKLVGSTSFELVTPAV